MCSLLLNVLLKNTHYLLYKNAKYCASTLLLFHQHVNERLCSYFPRMVGQDGYLFRAPGRRISDNSGFKLQATSCKPFSFLPFKFQLTLLVILFLLPHNPDSYRERLYNSFSLVENIGVEPMTSCLQSRRSSQLS